MSPSPVALITGASRGIGRALAFGLAADGLRVVVAAKSVESSDKLPGSVHSVAAEITSAGGTALAVPTDVRDEAALRSLIDATINAYGRLDLLVNNAGALFWHNVADTPAKRFDLVMSVNVRAAFVLSHFALPHLKASGKGHIVNMSPPMDLMPPKGRVAYAVSKLGMTLLTHGLAAEVLADNVAVNSLWPATIIESQASINHGLGSPEAWRTPEILVDCVRRMRTKSASQLTGRALIDEDFLREEGVTDFARYACVPGSEPPRVDWARW